MNLLHIIEHKLKETLTPQWLELKDESALHRGPPNTLTHCTITVVSEKFIAKSLLERHRLIYNLLAIERTKLHALSIHAYSPEEWQTRGGHSPSSAHCHGGHGK